MSKIDQKIAADRAKQAEEEIMKKTQQKKQEEAYKEFIKQFDELGNSTIQKKMNEIIISFKTAGISAISDVNRIPSVNSIADRRKYTLAVQSVSGTNQQSRDVNLVLTIEPDHDHKVNLTISNSSEVRKFDLEEVTEDMLDSWFDELYELTKTK
jgi:lantibiotic modifying enzyme